MRTKAAAVWYRYFNNFAKFKDFIKNVLECIITWRVYVRYSNIDIQNRKDIFTM